MARSRRTSWIPWREAVPGMLLGLAIGAAAAILIGPSIAGVTTAPAPFPDSWTYRYTALSILVVAVLGIIVAVAGLFVPTERQFYNYAVVGTGLGIVLLGTSYLALEKVEVTQDAVVVRGWWRLTGGELKFDQMRQIRVVHHQHRGWRRRHSESLHYEMRDGSEGTLHGRNSRTRAFFWAKLHLLHAAGKRGVEIKREHDNGE
jgi:hypothetical protein